ncbi:hypothetical protein [Heyndrickxia shackletonii]|uniref:hypothetical protein n=1 Tax=Heyndrickxia shackletonii TaxID=157838 RepID=UPI0006EC2BB6|nr:hypothetical protein [Heyndrickxia shackletonii]NEZ02049.1 hypothetical protein [Heyndrickxia shackletonii]
MKSKVFMINHQKGWIALLTENGTFSIAEVLEMELPNIGDIISGDIDSLGRETFLNETQNEEIDVFVQDILSGKKEAMRQLEIYNSNRNVWEVL